MKRHLQGPGTHASSFGSELKCHTCSLGHCSLCLYIRSSSHILPGFWLIFSGILQLGEQIQGSCGTDKVVRQLEVRQDCRVQGSAQAVYMELWEAREEWDTSGGHILVTS